MPQMKTKLAIIIFVLSIILFLPFVNAQQTTYSIPLEGIVWPSNTITVHIQSTPSWAHESVVAAMTAWNEAQVWFKNTYYPTGAVFNLVEAPSNTAVPFTGAAIVSFTSNTITCGQETADGCTTWHISTISTTTNTITTIDIEWTKDYTNHVSLHEVGRILGLGTAIYTSQLNGNPDIMSEDWSAGTPAISTLDLYAVHLMASGTSVTSATLPQNIPYMAVPDYALPEFSVMPLAVFCLGAALLLVKARQRKTESARLD
jgi:hypothetical protein